MKNKSGFSLVEMMIGTVILALAIGGFVMGLRASRSEVEFSDKHLSTLVCSQKVVEDIDEELWLNARAFNTLGVTNTKIVSTPVVDDECIFFSDIEFRAVEGSDNIELQGIEKEQGQIYDQISDLNLTLKADRAAPKNQNTAEANLYETDVLFSWGTTRQAKSEVTAVFFSPVVPKKVDPITSIPMTGSSELNQIIMNSTGGNPDALNNLAEMAKISGSFFDSDFYKSRIEKINELREKSVNLPYPSRRLYDCHAEMAKLWIEMARANLQFLFLLEPSLSWFVANKNASLGSSLSGANQQNLKLIIRDVSLLFSTFTASVRQAEANYRFLISEKMADYKGPRTQYHLIAQIIDLNRVIALLPNFPAGYKNYMLLIKYIKEFARNRNPSLERFVNSELENPGVEGMIKDLPNLQFLHEFFNMKIKPALDYMQSGEYLN
ncbi:MAG: hypothetical protein GQF41_4566 [Candidatus Rifleibacterium amylolyticum]|nr:MAG: hypothetical protein GQF41_4566 [Candidatus Rifleibacterium amylolyticum]